MQLRTEIRHVLFRLDTTLSLNTTLRGIRLPHATSRAASQQRRSLLAAGVLIGRQRRLLAPRRGILVIPQGWLGDAAQLRSEVA